MLSTMKIFLEIFYIIFVAGHEHRILLKNDQMMLQLSFEIKCEVNLRIVSINMVFAKNEIFVQMISANYIH